MYEVEVKVPAEHDEVRAALEAADVRKTTESSSAASCRTASPSDNGQAIEDGLRHQNSASSEDAERVDVVAQADTYYNAPHRDFAETDEALRVRQTAPVPADARDADLEDALEAALESEGSSSTSRVTYKGPLVDDGSKTREEFETGVDDGETMGTVFERLGFTPTATVRKVRARYRVGEWTVVLDDVLDVGTYVEVETDVENEDEVPIARDAAYGVLRDLGLDPEEQIQTSYLGLLLEDA